MVRRSQLLPLLALRRRRTISPPESIHSRPQTLERCLWRLLPGRLPTSRITGKFNDLFTANRFTSACSPNPYRDRLLGEGSDETIFACEPVHNLVHRARLVRQGLSFRAERFPADTSSEFFSSRDPWCRPVRVLTGPDGAVWIADMYRQVIEHPTWIPESWLEQLDVRAGHDKGRIYRVYPKNKKPTGPAIPNLNNLPSRELVALLGDRNGWKRDTAQRLLIERGEQSLASEIEKLVRSTNKLAAIHALGTLEGMGLLKPAILLLAIDHADADVRRWGMQFSDRFIANDPSLIKSVIEHADDPDQRVRLQTALTLGYVPTPAAASAIGKIAVKDLNEPWTRLAALTSSSHLPQAVLEAVLSSNSSDEGRSDLVDGLLATAIGKFGKEGMDQLLVTILPAVDQPIENWQLSALATLMDGLDRKSLSLAKWDSQRQGASSPARDRLVRVLADARQRVKDDSATLEDRVSAARILGRGNDQRAEDEKLLGDLLSPALPSPVTLAAAETLDKLRGDKVPDLLLQGWRSHGPALRSKIVSILLGRPAWTIKLIEALETGIVVPIDIDAASIQALTSHQLQDVAERSKKLFAAQQSTRQEVLDRYVSVLSMQGNASAGRTVFEKNCASCHRFGPLGQLVGPDIGGVRDRSPGYLLGAVLDPNRAVESKYVSYTVELADGRSLTGMLLVESANSITLARPDGTKVEILRVDMEQMVGSGRSFMPEGLEKDLDPQQLADLFAFLALPPESIESAVAK